jgi:hypothetical protein
MVWGSSSGGGRPPLHDIFYAGNVFLEGRGVLRWLQDAAARWNWAAGQPRAAVPTLVRFSLDWRTRRPPLHLSIR